MKEYKPNRYFIYGPFGPVECDYRFVDNMLPRLGDRPHPNPQHWYAIRGNEQKRVGPPAIRERILSAITEPISDGVTNFPKT